MNHERPCMVFMWNQFGPYHMARCEAAAAAMPRWRVVGLELASSSAEYKWDKTSDGFGFVKITINPNRKVENISILRTFVRCAEMILKERPRILFFCHYQRPFVWLLAIWCRILGASVVSMHESKFDDKQRLLFKEFVKWLALLPYTGSMFGSARTREYLQFLGVRDNRLFPGYNTVGVGAIRRAAALTDPVSFELRHFTIVARLVPKKNIELAIKAYHLYYEYFGSAAAELHICGSGACGSDLVALVRECGLSHKVMFRGFLQFNEVAQAINGSLALILPSKEEQFGLVTNEALALGIPVLLSDRCGARDNLIRSGVNGFVFEADNPEGLFFFMRIVTDPNEWRRLSNNCAVFAEMGGELEFGKGVTKAIASTLNRRTLASQ